MFTLDFGTLRWKRRKKMKKKTEKGRKNEQSPFLDPEGKEECGCM